MDLLTRTRATETVPIGALSGMTAVGGDRVRELADSIADVGLLFPPVVSPHSIDGAARVRALQLLGIQMVPVLRADQKPSGPVQAAAHRRWAKRTGAPFTAQFGRTTLDRVDRITAVAADPTLPLELRTAAAEGLTSIDAGGAVNAVFTELTNRLERHDVATRYPQLAHLEREQALRMAAYLDAFEPDAREAELTALALTAPGMQDPAQKQAMEVYAQMKQLSASVDRRRADEIAAALAAAGAGRALTPALRERCLDVAQQLEQTARGIRSAIAQEAA